MCDFEVPKMGHQHGGLLQRQLQLLGSLMHAPRKLGFLQALSNAIWWAIQLYLAEDDVLESFGLFNSQ